MTGLNYPDNLYADHEERKARRAQQPTGAYLAPPDMPESERKLRTALAYVNHARGLISDALKVAEQERKGAVPYHEISDVAGFQSDLSGYGTAFVRHTFKDGEMVAEHIPAKDVFVQPERVPKWDPAWGKPPNCDGHHPMQAEAVRDHDERLAGGESHL